LIEKRLKQVVVVLVENHDVYIATAERARRGQPSKSTSDDDDPWLGCTHAVAESCKRHATT
jgi:hypothetical protein